MEINSTFLLETVEKIFKAAEQCNTSEEVLKSTEKECKIIADFYSCSEGLESLLLAIFIHQSIVERTITNNSLAKLLHIPFTEIGIMVRTIWKLSRKRLVRSIRDRELGIKYKLYPVVFQSAYSGEKFEEVESQDGPTFKFISNIRAESLRLFNDEIASDELLILSKEIFDDFKDLPFLQWLNAFNLSNWDILIFINSCYEHIVSAQEISVDLILSLVFNRLFDRFEYKKGMTNGTNPLFKNGLIEWPNGSVQGGYDFVLTDKTSKVLLSHDLSTIKNEVTSKYFDILLPGQIESEQLLYNEREEKEVNILKRSLQPDNYNQVIRKLKANKFKKGLTILFYGAPGTGKTSSVYQIAKESGRTLLYTDATALKSMWLGESEKNIKKLFIDYYNISSQLDHVPILLFNEADAILSNRTKVNSSIDQTLNTIQNILLQELENFDGIFIATTNLTNNLDPAFERRFLYKLCFEKPGSETIDKLLTQAFPDVPLEKINRPQGRLSFTGSNIANMRKRLILRTAFENIPITPELINELAFEEFYNTNNGREIIGFKK